MKLKKLAALCAIACAGLSGQAMAAMSAAEQAIINDANTNGRVFFISGASATQKGFNSIVAGLFTGTPVRFANTTASSKDYEAVAGVLAAGSGPWSGKNVIIIDRVKGGSVFGVDPVARPVGSGTAIETLVVKSANCGATGAGTAGSPYVCDLSDGSVAKPHQKPDAGISDVHPRMFQSPLNTEGEVAAPALDDAELAEFADSTYNLPIYALAFGVPVTNNISPKLSKAAVSAIMAYNVGTWDQVDSSLAADDIVVCRRVPGSGTQAVENLYFGNFPCSGSLVNTPADRDSSGAWDNATNTYTVTPGTGGLVVIENSTSGDVRNCLDKAVTGGSYVTKDRDGVAVTVNFTAAGNKAIGVLSADSMSSSKTSGNWTFRSLDGGVGKLDCSGTCPATTGPVPTVAGTFPVAANLINGTWDMQGWINWNVPPRTSGNANKGPLAAKFATVAQDPAILLAINDLKWVAAAVPAPFSPYLPPTAGVSRVAYLNGNQCAPLNRNY